MRDEAVDFVRYWSNKTQIATGIMVSWIGISRSKFYDWQLRYGCINEHNAWIPCDYWLTGFEKQAIIDYCRANPLEGYRRLSYMMMDENIVACTDAGLLSRWNRKPSKKGKGFVQPLKAHEHWHIDVSYINICGSFYYMCSILDGFSRYIVAWDIKESMTEADIGILLQRAREKFHDARPRIISDNGPQFISKDFREFIRVAGFSHVRTSPYYPQSNGKLERYNRTVKGNCIRVRTPLSLADCIRLVDEFVEHYNNRRLHSAIDYITPKDKLEGRDEAILADRDAKLAAAREARKLMRKAS